MDIISSEEYTTRSDYSKKHPIRHFFYIAIGVSAGILAVFLFYQIAHFPYSGFYLFPVTEGRMEVIAVDPGSPGASAGLKAGDQIIKVKKQKIFDLNDSWDIFFTR